MAFIPTTSAFSGFYAQKIARLNKSSRRRKRATFSIATCCEDEARILGKIRANTTEKLRAQNIGIQDMVWKQGHLKVFVTSLDDLQGIPNCQGATVDDCVAASSVIGDFLDACADLSDGDYTLEVSTPGTKDVLTKDREFVAFQGFPVNVTTTSAVSGRKSFFGTLRGRSDTFVEVIVKGRVVRLPRELVGDVSLARKEAQ